MHRLVRLWRGREEMSGKRQFRFAAREPDCTREKSGQEESV